MAEEPPEGYVQIFCLGGWVHDVSRDTWDLIHHELRNERAEINFDDRYGSECWIKSASYIGARHWTPASGKLWLDSHPDE